MCLHTHMLSVNFVSSQQATPCPCFSFYGGGGQTCVIPELKAVEGGEGAPFLNTSDISEVKVSGQASPHVGLSPHVISLAWRTARMVKGRASGKSVSVYNFKTAGSLLITNAFFDPLFFG